MYNTSKIEINKKMSAAGFYEVPPDLIVIFHFLVIYLLSERSFVTFQNSLCSCQSCNWHTIWRATHIVESDLVSELN